MLRRTNYAHPGHNPPCSGASGLNSGTDLRVAGLIDQEPDRVGEGFAFGPTILLSREALDATRLTSDVRAGVGLDAPGDVGHASASGGLGEIKGLEFEVHGADTSDRAWCRSPQSPL